MEKTAGATGQREGHGGEEAEKAIRLGALEDYIGFHLRLAQNASFKAFKRHTGENDLRPGWFAVLAIIHNNPGITPMVLSRASGRDKSTITPVLRDLLRERLIDRAANPNDKRSYGLTLTAAGEEKLNHLSECAAEHDRELDEIVGEDKQDLLRLLRRIVTVLD